MTSDSDEFFPEPVRVPVQDSFDFHTFSPRDIPSVVESYLEAAIEAGFEEVRLIHGRGKAFRKKWSAESFRNTLVFRAFARHLRNAAAGVQRSRG